MVLDIKDTKFDEYWTNVVRRINDVGPRLKNSIVPHPSRQNISLLLDPEMYEGVLTRHIATRESARATLKAIIYDEFVKTRFPGIENRSEMTDSYMHGGVSLLSMNDYPIIVITSGHGEPGIDGTRMVPITNYLPDQVVPRIGLENGIVSSFKDLLWIFYYDYRICNMVPVPTEDGFRVSEDPEVIYPYGFKEPSFNDIIAQYIYTPMGNEE